jgi:hypothetical protein
MDSVVPFSDEDPGVTDTIGPINALAVIDPASAFVFYSEHTASERRARIIHIDTSGASLMGSGYPSMSGHTRVAAVMWARNLTAPDSTVNIERGYSIQMTSGSISIGGTTATWNDEDIGTLMSSLNDGEPHFLALDFENSGSNWTLNTSVDGATWTDQGTQNSGTQSPVTTDTSGEVTLTDPEPGQWLDELVLWGGDKDTLDKFTDNELFSLYSLAGSGLTMDQYSEQSAPTASLNSSIDLYIFNQDTLFASGDLYISGPVQFNSSADLFMNGSGVIPPPPSSLGRPLDWLLKTQDHNPQIIGTLGTVASGVNIQVWDVTDGQNSIMALVSSGCYQIGNTGRWGWSTANLPSTQGNARQYFYTMVSDVNESFDGQFILDAPEGAKWFHPRNSEEYLL